MANYEDTDEMQYNAAFYQGLHYLLRLKQPSRTEIHNNLDLSPLKVQNGESHTYCINMYGRIH